MAVPASWSTVTVSGKYVNPDGTARSGAVLFILPVRLVDAADSVILPAGSQMSATLDVNGAFSIALPVTDDADISPSGWTWQVVEQLAGGGGQVFNLSVPSAGGSIDLRSAVSVSAVASTGTLNLSGYATAAQLAGYVATLSIGTADDTAVINAALASAGTVKGKAGQTYTISAPLVVPSNTTLDMTGCTVVLKAGSNCNMVQNKAYLTSNRSVSDANITSGLAVLTSATASFTSADIGRTVVIQNALAASGPLTTTIASITDIGTVTLAVPAQATVVAGAAVIYTRDTDINLIGGTYVRGGNVGAAQNLHSILFRHVDRLAVRGLRVTSTAGKYAFSIGDTTRFRVEDIFFDVFSDGVHVEGACSHGVIARIEGTTGDDFVALTARSRPTYSTYEDVAGDITDVTVTDVAISGGLAAVKLLGGTSTKVRRVTVRNVSGVGFGSVSIGAEDQTLFPCDIDDVLVDGLWSPSTVAVNIVGSLCGNVTIRNLAMTSATASAYAVNMTTLATVRNLVVDGVDYKGASVGGAVVNVANANNTATRVKISNVYMTPGSSSYVVKNIGILTSLFMDKATIIGGSGFVTSTSGTLSSCWLTNCESSGSSWIADLGTTTDLYLRSVINTSPANGSLNLRATAVVRVRGSANQINGNLSTTAGYTLRVNDSTFACDTTKALVRAAGDLALNTNAGAAYGAGLVVSDGTNFKNVYSGTAGTP